MTIHKATVAGTEGRPGVYVERYVDPKHYVDPTSIHNFGDFGLINADVVARTRASVGNNALRAARWVSEAAGRRKINPDVLAARIIDPKRRREMHDIIEATGSGGPEAYWVARRKIPGRLPDSATGWEAVMRVETTGPRFLRGLFRLVGVVPQVKIRELYVDPQAQHHGVGTAMVRAALAEVPEYTRVSFDTPLHGAPNTWAENHGLEQTVSFSPDEWGVTVPTVNYEATAGTILYALTAHRATQEMQTRTVAQSWLDRV